MNTLVRDLLRVKGNAVETIAPTATILQAIKRMTTIRVGCLAVVAQGNRLVGIISERDCLWKAVAVGESPRTRLVKEKMTPIRDVCTVSPSDTVESCMSHMTTGRYRHLPVLEGKKLVGLVSIGDVVKSLISDQQEQIQTLEKYIEGSL